MTLREILEGFAIATVLGVLVGVGLGEVPVLSRAYTPYIVAFQVLPKVAIIPLLLLWFGFGTSSKVAVAAMFALLPDRRRRPDRDPLGRAPPPRPGRHPADQHAPAHPVHRLPERAAGHPDGHGDRDRPGHDRGHRGRVPGRRRRARAPRGRQPQPAQGRLAVRRHRPALADGAAAARAPWPACGACSSPGTPPPARPVRRSDLLHGRTAGPRAGAAPGPETVQAPAGWRSAPPACWRCWRSSARGPSRSGSTSRSPSA